MLQRVRLLGDFTPEQLRLLAFGAESLRVKSGRDLFTEGAEANCAYVVSIGELELYRESNGHRTVVGRAGPGSLIGELALISGGVRPTSALAAQDTEVIRLGRSLFRRVLEEYPELAAALHKRIAGELSDMVSRFDRVRTKYGG